MRLLLCAALALAALPALAQDDPEADDREVEIEDIEGPVHIEVERDGDDGHVVIRRRGGPAGENVFRLRMPAPDDFAELHRLGEAPYAFFGGDAPFALRGFMGLRGVSEETRERMTTLQAEARQLAREARRADGAERDAAVRRLDAVLADLFEVRGQARQEEAERLRERARELMDEAAELEDGLRERAARRQALIDARRAELLGETTTSDW